jgi:hypothetical protein
MGKSKSPLEGVPRIELPPGKVPPGWPLFVFAKEGGVLWFDPNCTVQEIGDGSRGLPSPVTYRTDGTETEPSVEFRFEVWDGIPVCTKVEIEAKPHARVDIRSMHIKAAARRLEDDLHHVLAYIAFERDDDPASDTEWVGRVGARTGMRKIIESARRTVRRKITPEFLQRVAKTYCAASESGVEAVKAVYGVDTRQAWRYISKAREAGLLADGDGSE